MLRMVSPSGPVPHSDTVRAEGGPNGRGTQGRDRPPLLPADLPKALTWLSDNELVELASAVAVEQARRKPEPLTAVADDRTGKGNIAPLARRRLCPDRSCRHWRPLAEVGLTTPLLCGDCRRQISEFAVGEPNKGLR